MIVVGEKKYACESCIKGHRSSACKHNDRPLFEVKKKGRPVTQCEHCRELRKTKQVHVKCTCDGRVEEPVMIPPTVELAVIPPAPPSNASSGVGKKRVKKPLPEATFPAGIPVESLEASAALQALSEGGHELHHRPGSKSCGCQSGQTCECCVPRPRSIKVAPQAGPSKQPQYRPVLPRPSNTRRLSDASHASMSSSGHDPSDPAHPHGGYGGHRGNSFFNPYPRPPGVGPFDYQHPGAGSGYSLGQGPNQEYAPPPPPSATSDGSVDEHQDYRSSPSLGYDFHHQPPAPPSGYADNQSQVHGTGYAHGGGRAQPHHEAPFAPPQTPTDVPQPSWPQTLPQHAQQSQSFSALGVGIRPDHSAVEALPPSVSRTPMMDMDRIELCGCGPNCACPGCVEHRGTGNASVGAAAYEMCADPKNCGTCLQCSILSMPASAMDPSTGGQRQPNFEFSTGGEAMGPDITMQDLSGVAGGEYFNGIDEWLRSVGPPSAQYPPSFTYTPDTGSVDEHQQQQYQYQQQRSQAERGTPSPAMYDYDVTFDPAMFASDPGGQAGMGMESLPELFLPDDQQRGWRQSLQSIRSFEEDGQGRVTTFATSGERSASSLASASTSSLSSSYASSLGDPLPSSPPFTSYTYPDPPALNVHDTPQPQANSMHQSNNNPELLVIPPTPAMRAGSGLGMSRNDTIDAAAENARYLAVREGSDGDGSSSPGSHYAAPQYHYSSSNSRRSTDNHSGGRPNISYPYPASVNTGSSSSASKMRSSSIFSGSSGSSRQSASSAPLSGPGSAQEQVLQQGRVGPDPNRSKTANLPKNFNPFNVFPGAWGSRFSGKF